jgi:deoxyribose-phosphate aldolase
MTSTLCAAVRTATACAKHAEQHAKDMANLTKAALAAMIDHTLLRAEATIEEVREIVSQGAALNVASVCITSNNVARVQHGIVPICTVIGFPSGAHTWQMKAAEAAQAVAEGAEEIDMVVSLAAVAERDWASVGLEISRVHDACNGKLLKVIVESALWEADDRLEKVCQIAVEQGADFLKTSTGMHAAGGASLDAVSRLARVAAGADRVVGVKASGGIRDTATALAMIQAGATRIGASATAAIVEGAATTTDGY